MRLTDIISNSNPYSAWAFDTTSNKFVNLLGTGNIGPTSVPTKGNVSYNGPTGALLTTGNTISTTFAYGGNTGQAKTPFTIEFVGIPLSGAAGLLVNGTNGLYWTGTAYEFRLQFTSGLKTVSYATLLQVAHLVAIYSVGHMELWLNGSRVGTLNISDADVASGFSTAGTTWTGPTTNSVYASAIAFYRRGLMPLEAAAHWIAPQPNVYNNQYTNRAWTMSNNDRTIVIDKTWQAEDWAAGNFVGGIIDGTHFKPTSGSFKTPLPVNQSSVVELRFTWTGTISGFTLWTNQFVQVSPTYDSIVPISSTVNPGMIEISTTDVDNFRMLGYASLIMNGTNNERTITIDSGVKTYDTSHPLMFNLARNTYIPASKKIVISADTSPVDIKNIGAIEMWCRAGASGATGTAVITGTTMYVNGVLTTTLPANTWVHVVFNRTADNAAITINGELYIASLNVYETSRSAGEALNLYNGWMNTPRIQQREVMATLVDDSPPARIYTSVWTPTTT